MKLLRWFLIIFSVLLVIVMIVLRINYGGGKSYPDISTNPQYEESQVKLFFSYKHPLGNIAVTPVAIRSKEHFLPYIPKVVPKISF